ncbi:MAG: cyclic nucleotide-binding domain-containing protein [Elusimicrobiota bacterium]
MAEAKELDEQAVKTLHKALDMEALYPSLSAAQVKELFPRSGLFLYPQDATVIQQGEMSKDLYVVCAGEVAIRQSLGMAGAEMGSLGPGELFGEIALIRDEKRVASAVAVADSLLFRLVEDDLKALVERNQKLAEHLKTLAEKRLYGD